jgi:ApaG protein
MTIIDQIFPYAATTRAITIRVAPRFHPDQSDASAPRYVWSYHVRVENNGMEAVQLRARYWKITDGHGRTEIVEGEGVIGQQPLIEPGQAFDYMSGCPLATPSGRMVGHYVMDSAAGRFDARIPEFVLEGPISGRSA